MVRLLHKPGALISALIMLVAVVALACGDDATAVPVATAGPAATAIPTATAVPAATEAPAATAVPQPEATEVMEPEAMRDRGTAKVETLVLGVDPGAGETNLPWGGIIDHHQQFDLVMEVLVDISPETALFVPELAKSWELSEDSAEWRFQLEEGVQWHNDWGEFTSADVMHSIAMWQRDDSLLAFSNDWREIDLETSEVVVHTRSSSSSKPEPRLPVCYFARRRRPHDE